VKLRHGWLSTTKRGSKLGSRPADDWLDAYRAFVDGALEPDEQDHWVAQVVIPVLLGALPLSLYQRGGIEISLLEGAARESLELRYVLPSDESVADPRRWVGADIRRHLVDPLVRLGAITEEDGVIALTPLGLWATNRLLRARGFVAPVAGELTGASALELLIACAEMELASADAEVRRWIAGRPATAAAELGAVAHVEELRPLTFHALALAEPDAELVVRSMLDDPELRPMARLWLVQQGHEDESTLPPEVLQGLFVDTMMAELDAEGQEAMVDHLRSLGPDDEQRRFIEGLLRADHPRATELLVAIGRHHPTKSVAKAARTTAFKRQGIRPN
jgi:hypothetical protein